MQYNEDSISSTAPGLRTGPERFKMSPYFWGALTGSALLFFYFAILTLSNSMAHAWMEFKFIWYWITAIALGFSIQTGLFVYMKQSLKARSSGASTMAVSGGMSTTSMVACCAHHLTEILPILGVSALSIFLTRFQTSFLTLGLFSNLIGIIMMLRAIQMSDIYDKNGRLARFMGINFKAAIFVTAAAGIAALGTSIYLQY